MNLAFLNGWCLLQSVLKTIIIRRGWDDWIIKCVKCDLNECNAF